MYCKLTILTTYNLLLMRQSAVYSRHQFACIIMLYYYHINARKKQYNYNTII